MIDFAKYVTTLPYFTLRESPSGNAAYRLDQNRLDELFKKDALAAVGLTGHPRADKAFRMAEEDGHAYGNSEDFCCLQKYADLLVGE